jgi:hypothetical protein
VIALIGPRMAAPLKVLEIIETIWLVFMIGGFVPGAAAANNRKYGFSDWLASREPINFIKTFDWLLPANYFARIVVLENL